MSSFTIRMPEIKIGMALSDAGFYHSETMKLPDELARFFSQYEAKLETQKLFFEFQPELSWIRRREFSYVADSGNKWLKLGRAAERGLEEGPYCEIIKSMRRPGNTFGVHQPIRDMDILSEDVHKKLETIESTQQAMRFAHLISADYFVFHLAQSRDYWDWNRSEQIEIALKAFKEWADFYRKAGFRFTPLIENLEFPKFPALPEEMISILNRCREFLPNVKLCFDIPHLWRSRALVLENGERLRDSIPNFLRLTTSASDYFDYAMEEVLSEKGGLSKDDIFIYHLAGCWKHLTHEIPGLRPGESPFLHKMRLDDPAYLYDPEAEIVFPQIINRLLRYRMERKEDIRIILEVYQRSYQEMLDAAKTISDSFRSRTRRIIENAHKYAYLWTDGDCPG
ncbi:MAG: TIM barrel protein [Pseudomonadota bacterium]